MNRIAVILLLLIFIALCVGFILCVIQREDFADTNILLSYPRSGNHLCRFFIEYLSEQPTQGCIGNKDDIPIYKNVFTTPIDFNIHPQNKSNYITTKYHDVHSLSNNSTKKLILIIRNPQEVLLRHNDFKLNYKNFDEYFENIDFYLNYTGPKLLLFYEDILQHPKIFVKKIYSFLNLNNPLKLKKTIQNYNSLFNASLNGKNRAWGGNQSRRSLHYYYKQTDKYDKQDFDSYLNKKLTNSNYNFIVKKYRININLY